MFNGFTILYGIEGKYVDVTSVALKKCLHQGRIHIPGEDVSRALFFGDPVLGVVKNIKIESNGGFVICPANQDIVLTPEGLIYPVQELQKIHQRLKFTGGRIADEYPEQLMSVMFIQKDSKVLELGSNIGRNTLAIASLLNSHQQLVTLECDPQTCITLQTNLKLNNMDVRVEDSALSKRKLFQVGWNTYTEETKPAGAKEVKTISFSGIEEKYQIQFDTLVADCEGALYFILMDDPDLLNNIQTVIMENDYNDINHKNKVDEILKEKGLHRIYVKGGGWGPCKNNFFETWVRE